MFFVDSEKKAFANPFLWMAPKMAPEIPRNTENGTDSYAEEQSHLVGSTSRTWAVRELILRSGVLNPGPASSLLQCDHCSFVHAGSRTTGGKRRTPCGYGLVNVGERDFRVFLTKFVNV